MKTVYELNKDEFEELRCSYFEQLKESEPDILEDIQSCEQIPDDVINEHYSGITFVDDDFFCNL